METADAVGSASRESALRNETMRSTILRLFLTPCLAIAPGCDCGGGGSSPDDLPDAALDAGLDATLDAAFEGPSCSPLLWEWQETVAITAEGSTGGDDEVEMVVVTSTPSGFALEADPES